jgi:hypothetical protein
MTRAERYIQLMKHLALLCALALAACVDASPGDDTGRVPQPDMTEVTGTPDRLDRPADVIFLTTQVPDADACVDDGCPDGLACDWVQGCTAEVTFCCVDEMCGEGRFCDFDAGGLCAPRP